MIHFLFISSKFVHCDTTSWDDQVRLFQEAASFSPTGKVSYVVANAGIAARDNIFEFSGNLPPIIVQDPLLTTSIIREEKEPSKPDLRVIDVNISGTLYTVKLSLHYFIKQNGQTPSPQQEDTCLILIGSGAAFLDCLRGPQYPATKWAMRGIMHSLRRTAFYYCNRVNVISPWCV